MYFGTSREQRSINPPTVIEIQGNPPIFSFHFFGLKHQNVFNVVLFLHQKVKLYFICKHLQNFMLAFKT